jgi:hypothetical protein
MEVLELCSFHYVNPEAHYADHIFLLFHVPARLTVRTKRVYELESIELFRYSVLKLPTHIN